MSQVELNAKMSAIAHEVRTLSGGTSPIGLDAMAENISNANNEISTQETLLAQAVEALEGKVSSYERGYSEGHSEGYIDGMDTIVEQTVVSYSNDNITRMNVAVFAGCTTLVNLSLTQLTHVPSFLGCTALKNVNLPNAMYIQSGVFKNCTALEKLDFPSAEQIHANTFENCTSLKTLILRRRANTIVSLTNTNSFANTPIANGTGYIYFYRDQIEKYKANAIWSTFASQFRAIEDYAEICGEVKS